MKLSEFDQHRILTLLSKATAKMVEILDISRSVDGESKEEDVQEMVEECFGIFGEIREIAFRVDTLVGEGCY